MDQAPRGVSSIGITEDDLFDLTGLSTIVALSTDAGVTLALIDGPIAMAHSHLAIKSPIHLRGNHTPARRDST
jgi:hypothetical protein